MKKTLIAGLLFGMLLLCSSAVFGFYTTEDFFGNTFDTSRWANVSKGANCDIGVSDFSLRLNGTSCAGSTGTRFFSLQYIPANSDGFFQGAVNTSSNLTLGLGAVGLFNAQHNNGMAFNLGSLGASTLNPETGLQVVGCSGSYKPLDGAFHTFKINVNRTINSTGHVVNTNFTIYWDGAVWCSRLTGTTGALYANISDQSTGSQQHVYEFDNLILTDLNITANCPAKPNYPIFAQDSFSYDNQIESCYWTAIPESGIYPTSGKLCYAGGYAERFEFYLPGQGNFYGSDVWTEEFDLILANGTYFQKDLWMAILSEPGARRVYAVDFFNIGTDTYIQYYESVNGTLTLSSLCSNCWNLGTSNRVKITHYDDDATAYSVFNSTSNSFQPITPNTYSIQINNGTIYFNLPIIEISEDDSNIPEYITLQTYGGSMCVDNYAIYSGLVNTPQIVVNATTPFLQVGEKCSYSWQCFTGYCDYLHICQKKNYLAACVNNFECISNLCANGFCTKPTLFEIVNQAKDDTIGDDEQSNNMISIMLSLFFGILVLAGVAYAGGGQLAPMAGGVVFVVSMFLFAVFGWLSGWIVFGLVLVMILAIALIILLGNRG